MKSYRNSFRPILVVHNGETVLDADESLSCKELNSKYRLCSSGDWQFNVSVQEMPPELKSLDQTTIKAFISESDVSKAQSPDKEEIDKRVKMTLRHDYPAIKMIRNCGLKLGLRGLKLNGKEYENRFDDLNLEVNHLQGLSQKGEAPEEDVCVLVQRLETEFSHFFKKSSNDEILLQMCLKTSERAIPEVFEIIKGSNSVERVFEMDGKVFRVIYVN